VTETIESTTAAPDAPAKAAGSTAKKRGGGLNSMLLADLKSMAGGMGIAGAGSMKKAQLVEAIKAAQATAGQGAPRAEKPEKNANQACRAGRAAGCPRREVRPAAGRASAAP
jgi:transcription termination factor Rho